MAAWWRGVTGTRRGRWRRCPRIPCRGMGLGGGIGCLRRRHRIRGGCRRRSRWRIISWWVLLLSLFLPAGTPTIGSLLISHAAVIHFIHHDTPSYIQKWRSFDAKTSLEKDTHARKRIEAISKFLSIRTVSQISKKHSPHPHAHSMEDRLLNPAGNTTFA